MKVTITKNDGTIIEMYDLTDELKRQKALHSMIYPIKTLASIVTDEALQNIEARLILWRNAQR